MRWMGNTISPACKRGGWGIFSDVKQRLSNLVSKMWLGLEETIEWYDKVGWIYLFSNQVFFCLFCFTQIDGFVAIPKYILNGR